MILTRNQLMNYLTLHQAADIVYGGHMEAVPMYDEKSEKAQELYDKAEKRFGDYMRSQNQGDMRDILESMMDNDPMLDGLLQASETQDANLIGQLFMDARRKLFWDLAMKEAEKE